MLAYDRHAVPPRLQRAPRWAPPPRRVYFAKRRQRWRRQLYSLLRHMLAGLAAVLRQLPRLAYYSAQLGGIAALTCGALYGWEQLLCSPQLAIHDVVVRGLTATPHVTAAQIVAAAALPLGTPMASLQSSEVAQRVQRHAWVRRAQVRRRWPDRVLIEVEVQQPRLLVSTPDLYVVNAQAELFKSLSAHDKLSLPVLTGLHLQAVPAAAPSPQLAAALALLQQLQQHPMEIHRLDELHWDAVLGWSMVIHSVVEPHSSVRISLGNAPRERVPLALATLRYCLEKGQVPQVIHADGSKNPQRVHVTLQKERGSHGTES